MSGGVAIRRASASDVPLILSLIHELARYEKLEHEVVATEEGLHESLFGSEPRAEVLIAETGGAAAGFALFFHNYSTFLGRPGIYLEDLFVRPEARKRGIGHALLRKLAAIALERRCGRLEWAVLDWNADAIAFYRRLGAVPMHDWTIFRVSGEALREMSR